MSNKTSKIHQMSFADWEKAFPDERSCMAYLTHNRWPSGTVKCPRCGNPLVKPHGTMEFFWLCNKCSPSGTNYRFSVIAGTIFENTNKPLRDWFRVIHLMLTSKKGISALQVHRMMGFGSYKTAWYMCHRVREGMTPKNPGPMGGEGKVIEADETYMGHASDTPHLNTKRKIVALVERGGEVRSFSVKRVNGHTISKALFMNADRKSKLMTDEYNAYKMIGKHFADHESVNHSEREYVRGEAGTNTVEGVFSIFKRGMKGVYQHCQEKHLHRYLAEFDFRYSHRVAKGVDDSTRMATAIKGAQGKRLKYRDSLMASALA